MYCKLPKAESEESKFRALDNEFMTKHFKSMIIYLEKFKNDVQNRRTVFGYWILQCGRKQLSGKFGRTVIDRNRYSKLYIVLALHCLCNKTLSSCA